MSTRRITLASLLVTIAVYAFLVYRRRWISDDGLIVVRTVRQILDGHGPVFNAFERAEANTSTLWTWLVAAAAVITRAEIAHVAVALGGLLAVAGVAIGLDAARRVHGGDRVLLPAGALVVLAVFPFRDFATSGLESGLVFAWMAAAWWLLVTLRPGRELVAAVIIGLGPLVRPDLAVVSGVFLVAAARIARPSRRRIAALAAAALALPLAYEVFRAGYYGTLVPLPALAKSATGAAWSRGLAYLLDFNHPYVLWLPLALLLAAFPRGRTRILVAAPVIAGVLLALFVVRVGGDFMHARMLLPPLFLVMLPAFVLPMTRRSIIALAAIACWAIAVGIRTGDGKSHTTASTFVEDEHVGYVHWTHRAHPIDPAVFVAADQPGARLVADALAHHDRLFISAFGFVAPLARDIPAPVVYAAGRLGTGGAVAPLDGITADMLGLANPLGARIPAINPGAAGHEKPLPTSWQLADFADPVADTLGIDGTNATAIRAARHAMSCGALAELRASTRAPLTARRFWDNLTGAFARTRLVVPADPFEAERVFCGDEGIPVVVSSSYEREGWSQANVLDGITQSIPGAPGWSSQVHVTHDHVEWIELRFPRPRRIAQVVLYPAGSGEGFPAAFTIDAGLVHLAYADAPHVIDLPFPVVTQRLRITGTQLRAVRGDYVMQLAEIATR